MNKIVMLIILIGIDIVFYAVDPFLGGMFIFIGGGWYILNLPRLDP